MTNNEILRSLHYTFRLDELKIKEVFTLVDQNVKKEQITAWLKKDDDEDFCEAYNEDLASFLNGFIILKRGKRTPDAPAPAPEKELSNNMIFKKLKIALNLQSEDILETLSLAGFKLSSHELTAFFRKEGHKNYRQCKNQVLRNFLMGLTAKYRENKSL